MYQNASTSVKPILDEFVAGWEVLDQVLIVNVVDFDDFVREDVEQMLVQW